MGANWTDRAIRRVLELMARFDDGTWEWEKVSLVLHRAFQVNYWRGLITLIAYFVGDQVLFFVFNLCTLYCRPLHLNP